MSIWINEQNWRITGIRVPIKALTAQHLWHNRICTQESTQYRAIFPCFHIDQATQSAGLTLVAGEGAIGRYRSVLPAHLAKGVVAHLAGHLPADICGQAGAAEVVAMYPVDGAAGSHRHALRPEVVVARIGDAAAGA